MLVRPTLYTICGRECAVAVARRDDSASRYHARAVSFECTRDLSGFACSAQIARQRKSGRGATLARLRCVGLRAHRTGEPTDHDRDDEHHRERQQVVRVADGKREKRRDETEIESCDCEDRRQQRRPVSRTTADDRNAEYVEHCNIGGADARAQHEPDSGDNADNASSPRIAHHRWWCCTSSRHLRRLRIGIACHDQHVDIFDSLHQRVKDRLPPPEPPRHGRRSRLTDHESRDVVRCDVPRDGVRNAVTHQRHRARTEALSQSQILGHRFAIIVTEATRHNRLDADGNPFGIQRLREAFAATDETIFVLAATDADENAIGCRPGITNAGATHPAAHVGVDTIGRLAQCQLAKCEQISFAKKTIERARRLLWHIYLSVAQPLDQDFRRDVHQFDLVRFGHHTVGNRFADGDAGDLCHDIVQAFDVLHVECAVHVEARIEEFIDILPPFGVATTRRVSVRQFIHQQQRRLPQHRRIDIEFVERRAAMFKRATRQNLEPFCQFERVLSAMRFDNADDDVNTFRTSRCRGFEHRECLADTGSRTEKQLEPTARPLTLLVANAFEKLIGIGAAIELRHAVRRRC